MMNEKLLSRKRSLVIAYLLGVCFTLPHLALAQETIDERAKRAERVSKLYKMAERAYRDGDVTVARETLAVVLAEQPGHAHSIALRHKIRLNGSQIELTKKKNKFNAVIIKAVDYKAVNLRQALKILNQQVMSASGKRVIPNFVLRDPNKYLGNERIELELNNVPAGVVLDHLMKKTGTSAKFGKYSITVSPRPSAYKKPVKSVKTDLEETEEE